MKLRTLIFLASLCVLSAQAQMIDNATGISLLEQYDFNPAFIRANKISKISGELSAKKESDIIRASSESSEYHFDRRGRLVQRDVVYRQSNRRNDRRSTIYRYDTDGTLIDRIVADLNGATSYGFKYDDQNRVVSETCSRMESPKDTLSPTGPKRTEVYTETFTYTTLDNGEKKTTYNSYGKPYRVVSETCSRMESPKDTLNPTGPKRTEVYTETFTYITLDNGEKKTTYNSYGKPYREEFFYRDDNDYLTEHRQRLLMNNRMSSTRYAYNERGLLREKTVQTDMARDEITRIEYDYDEAGNLLAAREFQNDEQIRRVEFLYDTKTWVLTARVTKDEETELIRIAKYETQYFE